MSSPHPPAAHILAYAQTLDGGGVERTLLRLVRHWSELGRRVTLVIGDTGGPLSRELPDSVETRVLGTSSMLGMSGIARLTEEVAPDVLFCPGNHYSGLAAWIRLRLGGHARRLWQRFRTLWCAATMSFRWPRRIARGCAGTRPSSTGWWR